MREFKNFIVLSADDILPAYNLMLPIIKSSDGDPEKFYPQFYKAFSSTGNFYKNLGSNFSLFLSFKVVYHLLAHLTGATIQEEAAIQESY